MLAIELMCACQGIEFRAGRPAAPSAAACAIIRERVPKLEEDREMDGDIEAITGMIREGRFQELLP